MNNIQQRIKAERIQGFGTTVFSVWSRLAEEYNAINLGQGFPDFDPPEFVMQAASEALSKSQQYAPLAGVLELRRALAEQYAQEWGRDLDVEREITVTVGATEGIYATIQALIDPGDEVILMEPFYDSYPASVIMAGGVPRYVPLLPHPSGHWELDLDELRKLLNKRTRMIILNNPHNPTGKCFTRSEIEEIADICQSCDLLVLSDEVYDQIVFDGKKHISIATLDGMWQRTVTLGSMGKSFSVTGWKIGWAIASAEASDAVRMAHQWIPFCVATPLQNASADILRYARQRDYYEHLRSDYQRRRDYLVEVLHKADLRPFVPEGTYFIIADTSAWDQPDDQQFCHYLTTQIGVVAIPPSHFYCEAHRHLASKHARFAFCKRDSVLQIADQRLTLHRS